MRGDALPGALTGVAVLPFAMSAALLADFFSAARFSLDQVSHWRKSANEVILEYVDTDGQARDLHVKPMSPEEMPTEWIL